MVCEIKTSSRSLLAILAGLIFLFLSGTANRGTEINVPGSEKRMPGRNVKTKAGRRRGTLVENKR
jgi:hypothetical protein